MKLMKLSNGNFRLVDGATSVEGQWPTIRAQLIFEYEIDELEVTRAIDDMREREHDTADFGVTGCFQYSYDSRVHRSIAEELKAIDELRREFHRAYKQSPQSPETWSAAQRLQMLYISLNVEACLLVIGEKKVA